MRPLEALAFFSLGTLWGAAFLFIKWAGEDFPPVRRGADVGVACAVQPLRVSSRWARRYR